jgi:hypothetical protein
MFLMGIGRRFRDLAALGLLTAQYPLLTAQYPLLTSFSPMLPRPPKRTPHIRPVQVFPQVHQRQKRAQNARLQIVRQVQSAGSHARQPFAAFRDKPHDVALPFVRRVSQGRFPAHLRAARFNRQREVQHAHLLLLGKRRRRVVLASCYFARYSHGARNLGLTRKVTTPRPENPVSFREMVRILHNPFPHPVSFPLSRSARPPRTKNDCMPAKRIV